MKAIHSKVMVRLCATAALASPLIWASMSSAQTAAAPPTTNTAVPEVVVTASKRVQRLQDVPASIVAETGAELEHRGATNLSDIINNTPGLNNPSGGPPFESNLVIRGVTTGASGGLQQSTVALLYDDIPIDPGANGGGTTNLRVVDVQRVEVLRGPQGTLFGSGSLSGAIRYVTNKPDLSHYSGSGEMTFAGTESGAASYNGTLELNAPLIEDKLGVRAVGYGYHDGGWIDNLYSGQKDINYTNTVGGRVMIAAKPIDHLYTNLSLFYQDSKDNSTFDSYYSKPAGTGVKGQVSDGIYEPIYDSRNIITSLYAQYDFEPASLISSTTYHDRKGDQRGTDYYFLPLTTAIATGFQTIINGPDQGLYNVDGKYFTQEIRLTSRGNGPLKWTVGGYYLNSDNSDSQEDDSALATPYIGGPNIVDLKATGTERELAGFGEATYTLFGKLDLTAGVRVSNTKLTNTVATGGYIPVFSVSPSAYTLEHFNENDTPVTPHFSIAYRFTPDFTVYGAAARGFRVGGINQTSGVGGRNSPGSYGPDSLWNYELGAKGKLFGGHLTYSADIYYIDWSNIQVSLQNNLGNYTGNAGEAKLYGFEGQVDAKPTSWLKLGASLALADNKISKGVDGLVTATGVVNVKSGDRLPASPEAQANAYSEVDFRTFGGHYTYIRLSGGYIGAEYTGFAKAGTKFGDYATADLRAGIRLDDGLEIIAFMTNLADTQGKQSASDASTAGPIVIAHQDAYRIRPRTLGVTLRADF